MGNDRDISPDFCGPSVLDSEGFRLDRIEDILQERNTTHGSFMENAEVSQTLKCVMRSRSGYAMLSSVHREALDMIALKISRILSGKANYADSWLDISGYATLAMESCDDGE